MTAVRIRGPGPGAYILPPTLGFKNHDVRKLRLPEYSFGTRHADFIRSVGPGPGSYFLGKITRHGNEGTPKYTIRPQTFQSEKFRSPGPAAHSVHLYPVLKGVQAPAFSMRCKHFIPSKSYSPSPNTYKVRTKITKQAPPAYTMGMALPGKMHICSPGPATYGRTNLNVELTQSPAYSITGRNLFNYKTSNPGPNAYNVTSYKPGKKGAEYSFGIRHSEFAPPYIVPCDNF